MSTTFYGRYFTRTNGQKSGKKLRKSIKMGNLGERGERMKVTAGGARSYDYDYDRKKV